MPPTPMRVQSIMSPGKTDGKQKSPRRRTTQHARVTNRTNGRGKRGFSDYGNAVSGGGHTTVVSRDLMFVGETKN